MNRATQVLVAIVALLLAGILVELHGLNRRLDATGLAATQLLQGAASAVTSSTATETEAQRKARIQATQARMARDFEYAISAPAPSARSTSTAPQTAPPAAPRR